MESHELKHRAVSANAEVGTGGHDRDTSDLARVGKKSVLKVSKEGGCYEQWLIS